MKKILLLSNAFLFLTLFNTVSATTIGQPGWHQLAATATPPAPVLTSFTALFGTAPVREWKLRSDGNWRAHFILNGTAWEATFANDGKLLKSEPK